MRRGFLLIMTTILACFVFMGAAFADYGYTNVSDIPMAEEFNIRVDTHVDGRYYKIETDYPFESTGASEINLRYQTPDGEEVFTMKYEYPSRTTEIGGYYPKYLRNGTMEEAFQLVESGKAVWDGEVHIGTNHFSTATDWFLVYSTNEEGGNQYTSYEERTHAQAYDGMGPGGSAKSVQYKNGQIVSSRLLKRIDSADLYVEYNQYGEITFSYISQYTPEDQVYSYSPYTGLFDGHKITELGFEEADLQNGALAAIGERTAVLTDTTDASDTIVVTTMNDVITEMDTTETTTTIAEEPVVPAVQADNSNFKFASSLIGGLLIGLTL